MKSAIYIGLMSGTSMDGLDMAACSFDDGGFSLYAAETHPFDPELKKRLMHAVESDLESLSALHAEFGIWMGKAVRDFIESHGIESVEAICSHGQTVLHRPDLGHSLQIGSGAHLATSSGCRVVCDFRQADLALGGQGAPLVPIAERDLFPEYDFFINLGGIANVSVRQADGHMIGFDVCACNRILNPLAKELGEEMDKDGRHAAKGKAHQKMLKMLISASEEAFDNSSLDAGEAAHLFFEKAAFFPLRSEDYLATAVQYIARMLASSLKVYERKGDKRILLTGGGTFNKTLIKRLKEEAPSFYFQIPDPELICYKEAIAFAYLGKLRLEEKVNILASVTGASRDSVGGAVYLP